MRLAGPMSSIASERGLHDSATTGGAGSVPQSISAVAMKRKISRPGNVSHNPSAKI